MLLDELGGNFRDSVIAIVAASAVKVLEFHPRGVRVGCNGQMRLTLTANVCASRVRKIQSHPIAYGQGCDAGYYLFFGQRCDDSGESGKYDGIAARVPPLTECRNGIARIECLLRGLIGYRFVGTHDRINLRVEFLAHTRTQCLA